jgi:hypothetical protein
LIGKSTRAAGNKADDHIKGRDPSGPCGNRIYGKNF